MLIQNKQNSRYLRNEKLVNTQFLLRKLKIGSSQQNFITSILKIQAFLKISNQLGRLYVPFTSYHMSIPNMSIPNIFLLRKKIKCDANPKQTKFQVLKE